MTEYLDEARQVAEARFESGWRPAKLLGAENLKLKKGAKYNWRGLGLSLAPSDTAGFEVCASKSNECDEHCIFTSGRGLIFKVMWGRMFRTIWYFRDRPGFMAQLMKEIEANQDAAIRLNVFSDIMWERVSPEIFSEFPRTQFYDYTKHFNRMFKERPVNYHLTFSLSETTRNQAAAVLQAGMNVAAVVDESGGTLFGAPVIDGDDHDLRFLDPSPCVVGLKAKGSLSKSPFSGMIYETEFPRKQAA